ncbi:MAG: hypothetical protein H2048_08050 [Erythrobacter sp.]|jgi:hypothetical protein|nr:hypothetical protein [Erythrobacter sp.]
MGLKRNRDWGKELAQAVLDVVDDPNYEPRARSTNWFTTWIDPIPRRERYRRWLSMWLKGALEDIPSEVSARYLEEMADDIRQLDEAQAVNRFIDKVLPKLLLNEPKDEGRSKAERFL